MLQSIRIFQNRVADSDQFCCTRARLNHGLWDIVEKDACAYHCATDGMLMALKRWNNTNNESKLNIIKNNSYKTNSYLHLLTWHSHNMRCAYKYVVIKREIKAGWKGIRYSRQVCEFAKPRAILSIYSSSYLLPPQEKAAIQYKHQGLRVCHAL